jgi:hypothetical protein
VATPCVQFTAICRSLLGQGIRGLLVNESPGKALQGTSGGTFAVNVSSSLAACLTVDVYEGGGAVLNYRVQVGR